jgi:hypothetical protein
MSDPQMGWDGGRSWGPEMPPAYGDLFERNAADWQRPIMPPLRSPGFADRGGFRERPGPRPTGPPPPGAWPRDQGVPVDNRAINREITKFYRLRELQRFCSEHIMNFNAVNTGTAFYQVGTLAKKTKGKKKEEPLDPSIVEALATHALMLASEFDAHSLTNVFWGYSNMGFPPPPQLVTVLCKRAIAVLQNFRPPNVAMFLSSFSKLEIQPPAEVLKNLLKRAVKLCPEFEPTDIAKVLFSMAKMNIKSNPQLVEGLEKRVTEVAGQLKPGDLSNVLYSYAVLGLEPPTSMVDVLSKRAKSMAGEFNHVAIVTFLWAFAKLNMTMTPEILTPLTQKVVQAEGEMDLETLSKLLWSLGKLGNSSTGGDLIASIEQKILAELGKKPDSEIKEPTFLANLFWSFGKLGRSIPLDVSDRINRRALTLKSEFKPSDICSFLWGCAKLGITAEPEVFKEFLDQISSKIAYLKSEDVSNILWTFATLGLDSQTELTNKLVKHAVTVAESFSGDEIASLLWGLAVLGQALPEIPSFIQAAANLLEKMSASHKGLLHQFFLSCTHDEKFKACCTSQDHDIIAKYEEECRSTFVDTTALENDDLVAAIERALSETGHTLTKALVDATTGYTILAVIQDGSAPRGCAVLYEGRRSYIQLSSGVRLSCGSSQLRKRHLVSVGYRAISVPFWEWDECALLGSSAQQGYLSNLLRTRPK